LKKLLRVDQIVNEKIPVSRSTWWRWVAEGKAPQPIKLGPKTTVWADEAIDDFITNQVNSSCSSSESGKGDE